MPTFTNLQSNRADKNPLPTALTDALQRAFSNQAITLNSNMEALFAEFDALDPDLFLPGGIERSTSTELRYFPSGVTQSGGELRVTGTNLPFYNLITGEFTQQKPSAALSFSSLSYVNVARDNQGIEVVGKVTITPYTLNVNGQTLEKSLQTLNFNRLTFGDDNLKLTLRGKLTVASQKMQVVAGQVVEPEPKISGSLNSVRIEMKDGADQYTLDAGFSLAPSGVSRVDSLTISKAGEAAFGFAATKLNLFINQDGLLSDAKGNPLGGNDIENIFRGNDVITGSSADDDLAGYAGNDRLNGGAGNDTLSGGLGKDVLTGGSDADLFVFDTAPTKKNTDRITDFSLAQSDKIGLSLAAFSRLSGTVDTELNSGLFETGAKATQLNTRILYDAKNGALLYDADGSGSGKAELIPIIGASLQLSAGDIVLLA